jgi:hypothetical protein
LQRLLAKAEAAIGGGVRVFYHRRKHRTRTIRRQSIHLTCVVYGKFKVLLTIDCLTPRDRASLPIPLPYIAFCGAQGRHKKSNNEQMNGSGSYGLALEFKSDVRIKEKVKIY